MEHDTPTFKLLRFHKLMNGTANGDNYGPQFGSTNRNEKGKYYKAHRHTDGQRKYAKYSRTTTIQY